MRGYVRYMDDVLVWAQSATELRRSLDLITDFLFQELGLVLKPYPYINRTSLGVDFLGCRIFRRHVTLNRRSRMHFRRRLQKLETAFAQGWISEAELQRRATSVVAYARAAGARSWRFRSRVLENHQVSSQRPRTG